ncbi:MAG: 1-acyl-sn-glycerol-3-phosphate acyltransferase [Anaerolineae bacterium]
MSQSALPYEALYQYLSRYHGHEIQSDAAIPDTPALIVCNHGFGGIVDLNVFALMHTFHRLDVARPVTYLVHQLAWTFGAGRLVEAFGGRPASERVAHDALTAGHHVVVFPGGDIDAGKSWRDRHVVKFGGRSGFAKVAMAHNVPIVPIVTAGAGESLIVLSDGRRLARLLRLPRLLRVKTLPVSLTYPWGLNAGVAGILPYAPLPTKLLTAVLPEMRPHDEEEPAAFASRVQFAMQDRLDGLVARRIPVIG